MIVRCRKAHMDAKRAHIGTLVQEGIIKWYPSAQICVKVHRVVLKCTDLYRSAQSGAVVIAQIAVKSTQVICDRSVG